MLPILVLGFMSVAALFVAGIIGRNDVRMGLSSLASAVSAIFAMNLAGGGGMGGMGGLGGMGGGRL